MLSICPLSITLCCRAKKPISLAAKDVQGKSGVGDIGPVILFLGAELGGVWGDPSNRAAELASRDRT